MKFLFSKFIGRREADRAATENSKALLAEVEATEPHVDEQHAKALNFLQEANERAKKLRAMDASNHYSESLTYSMRGNPA